MSCRKTERRYLVVVQETVRSVYEVSARTAVEARAKADGAGLGLLLSDPVAVDCKVMDRRVSPAVLAATTPLAIMEELRPRGEPEQCWPWRGTINRAGYGQISFAGQLHLAHRWFYEAEVGPIPDGLSVLHHCDYRACCNTGHLFTGTTGDNMSDKVAKGRQARGEANGGGGKLTEDDVREIRRLAGSPDDRRRRGARPVLSYAEIGARFGVTNVMVSLIVRGRQWSHVQ